MSDIDLTPLQLALESAAHMGRRGLLPALHTAQSIYGWIPPEAAQFIGKALQVPLADIHGVIEFYALFSNQPGENLDYQVCTDIACRLKMRHAAANDPLSAKQNGVSAPCLGLCDHAPAALIHHQPVTFTTHGSQVNIQSSFVSGSLRLLTGRCGKGTTRLSAYGDYSALRTAMRMTPVQVIAEVKASGLVGRGGAAFPTGIKWEGAANAEGETKYVVCNADESEPGTFKDRVLLMDDPHSMLEGMLIAAYAVGAQQGIIYLRGEYAYLQAILQNALDEARKAGYLGQHILGSNFAFELEIFLGAGAYICGEETALFESIEGKRGFPRVKPPFPTTHGLFGMPTVINNVETLCNIPLILSQGARTYRTMGTEKSPGPKLFCLSGDIQQPGLYEVPFGTTLRTLLDLAGGVARGDNLQAILLGGAAGAFVTPEQLDIKLTFEDLRAAGLPLGSGVVMAFNSHRDLRAILAQISHFFAHESCGKCYPCQMGTQRQKEVLERLAAGTILPGDAERLADVGWTMTDASLCGLGQTAASAVISALQLWPGLFSNGS